MGGFREGLYRRVATAVWIQSVEGKTNVSQKRCSPLVCQTSLGGQRENTDASGASSPAVGGLASTDTVATSGTDIGVQFVRIAETTTGIDFDT